MNRPDSSTSPRRSFNSGIRGAYCALTSTSGIMGTGAPPEDVAVQEPGRGEADRDDDSVVHPTEILVYPSVAGSDTPTQAREGEGPDRGAREREQRVAAKGARKTPAGMEMNERISGVTRPRKTAASPRRSNHSSARAKFSSVRCSQRPRPSISGLPPYAPIPQPMIDPS